MGVFFKNKRPECIMVLCSLVLFISPCKAQWDDEDMATIPLRDTIVQGAPQQSKPTSDSAKQASKRGDSVLLDLRKIAGGRADSAKTPAKRTDLMAPSPSQADSAKVTIKKADSLTITPVKPASVRNDKALVKRQSEPVAQDGGLQMTHEPFSIFNYSKMIELGLSLNYFFYNEYIEINDLVQSFVDTFGRVPEIKGEPKSTEYGGVFGFTFNSWFYSQNSHIFARPKFSMIFGIGNAYDGSSQADSLLDTNTHEVIGIEFKPKVDNKDNYFISTGLDIGLGFPKVGFPMGLYTGIDFKFWYRDMLMYSDNSSNSGVTWAEMYYWFSAPIGLLITKPISDKTVLGMDARLDLMFFGQMKTILSSSGSDITFNFPAVTLGDRASYKLELFAQTRVSDAVSLKFSSYAMVYGFGKSNTDIATVSVPGYGTETIGPFWEPTSGTIWAGFNFAVVIMPGNKLALNEKGKE